MRTSLMAIAGWILATTAAVTVGILATSTIGHGITNGSVDSLGEDKVAAALAKLTDRPSASAPTQPSGSRPTASQPSPSRASTATTKVLNSPGGSVVARCTGDSVRLLNWTPAQGFTADDDVRREGTAARVKFESEDEEYRVNIACRDGVPQSIVERDD
jgi:hypothetical protein